MLGFLFRILREGGNTDGKMLKLLMLFELMMVVLVVSLELNSFGAEDIAFQVLFLCETHIFAFIFKGMTLIVSFISKSLSKALTHYIFAFVSFGKFGTG